MPWNFSTQTVPPPEVDYLIIKILITTHPQFNVLCGSLVERLEEPWYVSQSTLLISALLPIPLKIRGIEVILILFEQHKYTVVVTAVC